MALRHAIVEERMYNDVFRANKGHQAMDLILSALCMVICNKVPKGIVSWRTDSLANKIKLVTPPRGVEAFDRTAIEKGPNGEVEVEVKKNTNERAIVRILVPRRTMTLSEINAENKKGDDDGEGEEGVAKDGEDVNKSAENADYNDKRASDANLKVNDTRSDATGSRAASRLSRVPSERIVETD